MKTELGQRQTQQQRQVQTTSAVQVILSTILEMPLADLEQHVRNEIDENAAIEVATDDERHATADIEDPGLGDEIGIRDSHMTEDDYSECLTIDQVPEDLRGRYNDEMRTHGATRSQYDGDGERQIADTSATTYDDIVAQIGEHDLTDEEVRVMLYLVGSLDERGYLTKETQTLIDELTFQEYIYIDTPHIERLIALLQTFEPRGIGARNLRECLLLQMVVAPEERVRLSLVKRLAHKVVRDMWDDVTRTRWSAIQERLDVDDETMEEIRSVIRHLNPHPGGALGESIQMAAPTVIADFIVTVDDNGELIVSQTRGDVPELRVSQSFTDIVDARRMALERAKAAGRTVTFSRAQDDSYDYALHKVESARAFIESLRRRHQTLQAIIEAIVRKQREFFVSEDDEMLIQPMVLRDVATAAGVDISTVSRAVNSKFVRTDYGTYPLKYFFGTQFTNTEGDSVSQRIALKAIERIIKSEDPHHPYSDQRIMEILAEEGTTIARRTVAKYRERLGYSTSNGRRR